MLIGLAREGFEPADMQIFIVSRGANVVRDSLEGCAGVRAVICFTDSVETRVGKGRTWASSREI